MKKNTLLFLFASLLLVITGCDSDSADGGMYDVGFESAAQDVALEFEDTNVALMVEITSSTVSSAPRFVNLVVGSGSTALADSYVIPEVIRIPENSKSAFIEVAIKDPSGALFPAEEESTLVLEVAESNAYTATQSQTVLNITRKPCPYPKVELEFFFDGYASEISWEIRDSSDTVVASGDSYANGLEALSQPFCLSNGTYTFEVFDSYGDGLSYPADGYAKITVDGTEVVSIEGNFGKSASGDFTF